MKQDINNILMSCPKNNFTGTFANFIGTFAKLIRKKQNIMNRHLKGLKKFSFCINVEYDCTKVWFLQK